LRTEWARDRQEAETKRQDFLAQHEEIKRQRDKLADLGPDGPCPICTAATVGPFREVLDDLDGRLNEIVAMAATMPSAWINSRRFRTARVAGGQGARTAHQVRRPDESVTAAKLRAQESQQVAAEIAARESGSRSSSLKSSRSRQDTM